MTQPISNLRFEYMNTSERRVLNLEPLGLPNVPVLGYCHYRSPRPDVPEHWHPGCVEIHLGVRNVVEFGFDGRTYRLGPGDVFVNLPGERHTVSAHPNGLILYWLILRVGRSRIPFLGQPETEAEALRKSLLQLPHRHFRGTETLKRLFRSLHLLCDEPATHLRALRLRTTLLALLLEVVNAAEVHRDSPGETRLEALLREMRTAPEKAYRLDDLARRAGMAPSHFIARFRSLTGLPPHHFLLHTRIEAARRLLRESDVPITELALRLGFCSSQHFAHIFKRHTGITPRACRKGACGPLRAGDDNDGQSGEKRKEQANALMSECGRSPQSQRL
jgi:AraC-like DNA-binding protein